MKNKFIFIGIDPGSRRLGYALILLDNGIISLQRSGVLAFSEGEGLPQKLLYVFNYFKDIILEYIALDIAVYLSIEKQYVSKNPHSAFILVSFYSIFLLLAALLNIECCSMAPTQIKKIISGSGSASKEDLTLILAKQFNLDFDLFSLDESDAIAIALSAAYAFILNANKY